jgi:hypothetical protein
MRNMLEREREDAKAATELSIDLLLWYVGARYPARPAKPKAPAARTSPVRPPKGSGSASAETMSQELREGIVNKAPPVIVKGEAAAGGAVVRKTVETAKTLLGRTRFGRYWGAASIRAQEQALLKLEAAGVDAAKIRQSFNETGELIMDYVGPSVEDQWGAMSSEARAAYRAYVSEAKGVVGRVFNDLKPRNIAYQMVNQDGQVFHRFIAFDPALDKITVAVGVVAGTLVSGTIAIGSLELYSIASDERKGK